MPDRSRFTPAGLKPLRSHAARTAFGVTSAPASSIDYRRVLLALALACGVSTALANPEQSTPNTPNIPDAPPSAPAPSYSPPSNYDSGYSGSWGNSGSNYSDYGRDRFGEIDSRPRYDRTFAVRMMPIYFPPVAPRLNAHVDLANPAQARSPAPAELALYINEPFYPQLSTRLTENSLREGSRKRLDAYMAAKLTLQNELQAKLVELRGADSVTRERALQTLAREQESRIAALEKDAEGLRSEIIHGELFQSDVDWNATRDWRLGDRFYSATAAIGAQFQVTRAAAFYQKGLSPAQRRLLHEVAMELGDVRIDSIKEAEAQADEEAKPPTDTNPLLYFSPETARVRLPADLPADLAEKVASYEREKSQLKKELRDMIVRQDRASLGFLRQRAFSELARQQEPRIAALENLAEQIRHGLAQLPNQPQPPEPPDLPPDISNRLTTFVHDSSAMRKAMLKLIMEAGRSIPIRQIGYVKDSDGHTRLKLMIDPGKRDEEKVKQVQASFAAYAEQNGAHNQAIVTNLAGIRRDTATYLGFAKDDPTGQKEVERLLVEASDTIEARLDWQLYNDYRTAVLEPGLSPGQRRLLYDASLVELDLPLPGMDAGLSDSGTPRQQRGRSRSGGSGMEDLRATNMP